LPVYVMAAGSKPETTLSTTSHDAMTGCVRKASANARTPYRNVPR